MQTQELLSRIGPIDGTYLRPFVSDGPPEKCPVALIGYNAATAIPASEIEPDAYCRLLMDRSAFEAFYGDFRMRRKLAEGKTRVQPMSTTRKRLALLRQGFGEMKVVETNLNAYPTKNVAAMRRLPADRLLLGRATARWVMGQLRPSLVLVYGEDISLPRDLASLVTFQAGSPPRRHSQWLTHYREANWNGTPTQVVWLHHHLAARGAGMTDGLFQGLGKEIAGFL